MDLWWHCHDALQFHFADRGVWMLTDLLRWEEPFKLLVSSALVAYRPVFYLGVAGKDDHLRAPTADITISPLSNLVLESGFHPALRHHKLDTAIFRFMAAQNCMDAVLWIGGAGFHKDII